METLNKEIEKQSVELRFADRNPRIAWEVGRAVRSLEADLPAEGNNLEAKPISFSPEQKARGTYAILMLGTVIYSDRRGVYLVPQRSLTALERLGIEYKLESRFVALH